ncbi:MAG: hypothetical protein H0T78_00255 [Longispora sp.]|nr:hypothetical protein [Longispora sp. (in: high G+C Gram-positive bacteria)]
MPPPAPEVGSAYGSTPIRTIGFSTGGISLLVPTGCFLTHGIHGKGTRVESENAGTDCAGPGFLGGGFANWRIDFQYFDTNNHMYENNVGPINYEMTFNNFRSINHARTMQPGRSCAVFFSNGQELARQCHNILK